MNLQKILECEAKRLRKIHLLPNYFKKIAVILAIASIFVMAIPNMMGTEPGLIRSIGKNLFLVAMLIFSLSKEKIEDELIMKLRAQSYSFAFVIGVIYAIAQPYITYGMQLWLKPEKAQYADLDMFIILWFMLLIQLMFFHLFKKAR